MGKAQILVVEDEGIVAIDIQNQLKSLGYSVPVVVSSGEQALKRAEKSPPDLVLMDIRLKGEMDGIETAKQIRDHLDIPVVYLTAYADDNTLDRAKLTESYGYLIKPFEEKELYITIEMAMFKHNMEKRLKESERWLSTTLNSIADAVIATDPGFKIRFMNPIAESLTGWSEKEALGRKLTEVLTIIDGNTRKVASVPTILSMQKGAGFGLGNHTILVAKMNREIFIEMRAAPIKSDRGEFIGSVLVFHDITERKKEEETLQQMAATIAHEIRNPVNAIAMAVELLESGSRKDSTIFKGMKEEAKRIQDIVTNFLKFAKPYTPQFAPNDINAALEEIVSLLKQKETPQGIVINTQFDKRLPMLLFDRNQMRQVLWNLSINGIQAMTKGGILNISSRHCGSYVEIEITDNGKGIKEDDFASIFQPFFTTKEEGTGLGLAISEKIMKVHGGSIEVKSKIEQGTSFLITLPMHTVEEA